jgi:hypothetical protein
MRMLAATESAETNAAYLVSGDDGLATDLTRPVICQQPQRDLSVNRSS